MIYNYLRDISNTIYVDLISCTPDIEKHIAFCARVSNPNNQENEKFKGLIKYCLREGHWSVFEQGYITMEITTSRAISRQLLRHRSFTFQEFSQRYSIVDLNRMFIFGAREQDAINRQNSTDTCDEEVKEWFKQSQIENFKKCLQNYMEAISRGIAKEQARCLLPEGNTLTTVYMTGSVRSWIHFVSTRMGNGSQKEISDIANQCFELLKITCPTVFQNLIIE